MLHYLYTPNEGVYIKEEKQCNNVTKIAVIKPATRVKIVCLDRENEPARVYTAITVRLIVHGVSLLAD